MFFVPCCYYLLLLLLFLAESGRYFLTVLQFFVFTCFNIYLFTMIGIFPIHVLFIGLKCIGMDLMQSHLKLLSMYYLLATEALGKLHPSI